MATTVYEREVMGSAPRGLTLRAREVIRDSRMWLMESLCAKFRPEIVLQVFVK